MERTLRFPLQGLPLGQALGTRWESKPIATPRLPICRLITDHQIVCMECQTYEDHGAFPSSRSLCSADRVKHIKILNIDLFRDGTFSSVPNLTAWSFLATYPWGNWGPNEIGASHQKMVGQFLPPPRSPSTGSGAAVSPSDKSEKDGGLPVVTSEKAPSPHFAVAIFLARFNR